MRYIPGIGPSDAKLMIVGEAPGADEESSGLPFTGASGRLLTRLLLECGYNRNDAYITNVVKVRPPGNSLKRIYEYKKNIQDYIPQLYEEINQLNPNCILALGNTALEALTDRKGIENQRGSIIKSLSGHKVVPTLHPAAFLHGGETKLRPWRDLTYIRWDIQRAIKQSKFAEYNPPSHSLIVCKRYLDLYRFLNTHVNNYIVAVDIETFRTIPICISFAFNSYSAISIPLFNISEEGMTRNETIQCWRDIADTLANPRILKIGQNFKFDMGQLELAYNRTLPIGLKTNGFYFDTQLAFRTLYPELPASLAFICSVLTEIPYYKNEGREYNPRKDKLDKLLLYNAKDAVATFDSYEKELQELKASNLEDFFFTKVMPLNQFYSRIENRGIKRDELSRNILKEKYKQEARDCAEELLELIKEFGFESVAISKREKGRKKNLKEFNVSSAGKNSEVRKLLFQYLQIPERAKTDEKTLDALIRNVVKDKNKKKIIELILKLRKIRKTIGTYILCNADSDGRLRTQYRIALETGRTSTNTCKSPIRTEPSGMAFQTITKHGETGEDLRLQFVPDAGHIFIEVDQSGAEARVVALLARDVKLLKMFEYGIDSHRVTKGWIDNWDLLDLNSFFEETNTEKIKELVKKINKELKDKINDEERQIGKKFRHAANYDMQKRTASENAGVSEWSAGKILERVHKTNPGIKEVFHREIQEVLSNNDRRLRSPNGRIRQFLGQWGRELFKEAYAQIPQSTVSDQTKQAGINIELRLPFIYIVQESHDSLLIQCPIEKATDHTFQVIKEEFEFPIDFSKCSLPRGELIIPCEFKIGEKNWLQMKELKI